MGPFRSRGTPTTGSPQDTPSQNLGTNIPFSQTVVRTTSTAKGIITNGSQSPNFAEKYWHTLKMEFNWIVEKEAGQQFAQGTGIMESLQSIRVRALRQVWLAPCPHTPLACPSMATLAASYRDSRLSRSLSLSHYGGRTKPLELEISKMCANPSIRPAKQSNCLDSKRTPLGKGRFQSEQLPYLV